MEEDTIPTVNFEQRSGVPGLCGDLNPGNEIPQNKTPNPVSYGCLMYVGYIKS